jgi:hypothetical protein
MRGLLCGCVALAAVLADSRPIAQTATPAGQQPAELPETWLEGNIGRRSLRMFLEAAGWPKDDGVWGVYYYTDDRFPITLEGERLPNGVIRVYEGDPGDSREDRARMDLSFGSAVTGTWMPADGGKTLPVRLRRTKQPAPFEIAVRNARRFANPGWLMELTYPAGWFLEASGTHLKLRSPDPQDMMFDNALTCNRGRGLPRVPGANEAAVEFEGSFFRTHDGWRIEGSPTAHCERDSCVVPKTRQVGTMIIMSGEASYRSHNGWGYAGIAETIQYLLIDGEDWVHCVDRLLDSDSRITPRPASARSRR